jgi:hypothetical protein
MSFHISKSYLDKHLAPVSRGAGLSKSASGGGKAALVKRGISVAVQGGTGFALGMVEAKFGMPKVWGPFTADVLAGFGLQALLAFKPALLGKAGSYVDDASKAAIVYWAGAQGNIMGGSAAGLPSGGGKVTELMGADGKPTGNQMYTVVRGEQGYADPRGAWQTQFR